MRFPRNAKVLRSPLDAAPFAGVFVLLLMFLLLQSNFVYTTGVKIELPAAGALPGTRNPTVIVAVDRRGGLYFANQLVREDDLQRELAAVAQRFRTARQDVTLVVQADKTVPLESVVRLAELARAAGIKEILQATRPGP
jgi:biopolymer transport protein ExbD